MNTVIITEKLNTHDHGHMYHQKVGKIGMEIGMEYSYTNTIIRKLFDRNFTYSRKILAMEPREVYAFVINNADLLRHTVREGIVRYDEKSEELCICMDSYSNDINSDSWVVLSDILK